MISGKSIDLTALAEPVMATTADGAAWTPCQVAWDSKVQGEAPCSGKQTRKAGPRILEVPSQSGAPVELHTSSTGVTAAMGGH